MRGLRSLASLAGALMGLAVPSVEHRLTRFDDIPRGFGYREPRSTPYSRSRRYERDQVRYERERGISGRKLQRKAAEGSIGRARIK